MGLHAAASVAQMNAAAVMIAETRQGMSARIIQADGPQLSREKIEVEVRTQIARIARDRAVAFDPPPTRYNDTRG